jgi:hypothetical protein
LEDHERFSSTRSLTRVIRNLDVEQDHDLGGGGSRDARGSDELRRAIMHPCERAKSEGLSTALLCQHDVLCHIAKEYGLFDPAARQEWLGTGDKCDRRTGARCCFAASIMARLLALPNGQRVSRIVAATTSRTLYISHLIQGL